MSGCVEVCRLKLACDPTLRACHCQRYCDLIRRTKLRDRVAEGRRAALRAARTRRTDSRRECAANSPGYRRHAPFPSRRSTGGSRPQLSVCMPLGPARRRSRRWRPGSPHEPLWAARKTQPTVSRRVRSQVSLASMPFEIQKCEGCVHQGAAAAATGSRSTPSMQACSESAWPTYVSDPRPPAPTPSPGSKSQAFAEGGKRQDLHFS